MLVEVIRLLFTLVVTAVGYEIGSNSDGQLLGIEFDPASARLVGALIGAGVGYVVGGAGARLFTTRLDTISGSFLPQLTGPELFAGGFGVLVGLVLGVVISIPVVRFTTPSIGWTVAALVVTVCASLGGRIFGIRSQDLLTLTGLRPRGPLVARRLQDQDPSYVLDSSAAIDGRILELVRMGMVQGRIWIPFFVVDEMQGLADAGEKSRRRRGKRGLEILDALRSTAIDVAVLDDSVPEFEDVDAKLLALSDRSGSTLITSDQPLAKAAEVRGIKVLNPGKLGETLKPLVAVGQVVNVPVTKTGQHPRQGVGYLDDGTMVVIEDAVDLVGEEIAVEVTSTTKTAVGRMLFGRPVDRAGS